MNGVWYKKRREKQQQNGFNAGLEYYGKIDHKQ